MVIISTIHSCAVSYPSGNTNGNTERNTAEATEAPNNNNNNKPNNNIRINNSYKLLD